MNRNRSVRPLLLILSILAAATTLCLAGAAILFCQATLHRTHKPGSPPAGFQNVRIAAPDTTILEGSWLHSRAGNGRCVVILHGIGDSRAGAAGFAPLFLDSGYSVLLPDSRGHGASGGEYITYGLLEKHDVLSWVYWMRAAGCTQIYGLGESLGAAVLIQAAAVKPVFSAIVAECAFADLRDVAEYRIRTYAHAPALAAKAVAGTALFYAAIVDGIDLRDVSPVEDIRHTSTPMLLIHGLSDWRTPPLNSIRLKAANPANKLWLVPNAQHTGASSVAPEEFRRRVLSFFAGH